MFWKNSVVFETSTESNIAKECFIPFVPNAPFLYPLKTSENLTAFGCFQGVKKGCIENECVKAVETFSADSTPCSVVLK